MDHRKKIRYLLCTVTIFLLVYVLFFTNLGKAILSQNLNITINDSTLGNEDKTIRPESGEIKF